LVVDAALNVYFLYLVKNKLMGRGMSKYKPLFKFNAAIVLVSLSMDVSLTVTYALVYAMRRADTIQVLIIAMMSLKNTFV